MQVSPVIMSLSSLRTTAPPPCLPLSIKNPLKEEEGLFVFALGAFAFCFGPLLFAFGAFWCGKALEGKIFLKGKELLEENC
jgi:hypothetical protein